MKKRGIHWVDEKTPREELQSEHFPGEVRVFRGCRRSIPARLKGSSFNNISWMGRSTAGWEDNTWPWQGRSRPAWLAWASSRPWQERSRIAWGHSRACSKTGAYSRAWGSRRLEVGRNRSLTNCRSHYSHHSNSYLESEGESGRGGKEIHDGNISATRRNRFFLWGIPARLPEGPPRREEDPPPHCGTFSPPGAGQVAPLKAAFVRGLPAGLFLHSVQQPQP